MKTEADQTSWYEGTSASILPISPKYPIYPHSMQRHTQIRLFFSPDTVLYVVAHKLVGVGEDSSPVFVLWYEQAAWLEREYIYVKHVLIGAGSTNRCAIKAVYMSLRNVY